MVAANFETLWRPFQDMPDAVIEVLRDPVESAVELAVPDDRSLGTDHQTSRGNNVLGLTTKAH